MVSECKGVLDCKFDKHLNEMLPQYVAPNQKLELQKKLFKTTATKHQSKSLVHPNWQEIKSTNEFLNSFSELPECEDTVNKNLDEPNEGRLQKKSFSVDKHRNQPVAMLYSNSQEIDPMNVKLNESAALLECQSGNPNIEKLVHYSEFQNFLSFTPHLNYVKDISQTILKIGDTSISLLHLKSLDPFISHHEEAVLKSAFSSFEIGWLYDTIIDAFLHRVSSGQSSSLSAVCALSSYVLSGGSLERAWENEILGTKEYLYVPANPTNNHWILLVARLKEQIFEFFDPLNRSFSDVYVHLIKKWQFALNKKLNILGEWKIILPLHPTQVDSMSCGVFICYFAFRKLNKLDINTPVDTNCFRKFIYHNLTKDCLSNEKYIACSTFSPITCKTCSQNH